MFLRHLTVAALVAWPLAPLLAQGASASNPPTILRGRVVGAGDRIITSAPVNIVGTDHGLATDDDGEFTFVGLPTGTCIVEVLSLGYAPRRIPVSISDTTPYLIVHLDHFTQMLDSMHVVSSRAPMLERGKDRVGESEFAQPEVAGGNALDALELLRPQIFVTSPPTSPNSKGSSRGRIYSRDATVDWRLNASFSVSINEGLPQAIDILTTIPARTVREMRYLRPLDAQARFGVTASGPVLIVYTITPPAAP